MALPSVICKPACTCTKSVEVMSAVPSIARRWKRVCPVALVIVNSSVVNSCTKVTSRALVIVMASATVTSWKATSPASDSSVIDVGGKVWPTLAPKVIWPAVYTSTLPVTSRRAVLAKVSEVMSAGLIRLPTMKSPPT